MDKWEVQTEDTVADVSSAMVDRTHIEDALGFLLGQWQNGELTFREVSKKLAIKYYQLTELASDLGYSMVQSGPNDSRIAEFRRRKQSDSEA